MPIPAEVREAAERALAAYCADCVPEKVRHLLETTYRFDGNNVYVVERRPSTGRGKRWEECHVARFRYVVARDEWLLYWRDAMSAGIATRIGAPPGASPPS